MIPIILVIVTVFTAAIAGWLPFSVFGTLTAVALLAILFVGIARSLGGGDTTHPV